MKKSQLTEEQIAVALHRHEAGSSVGGSDPQTESLGADLLPLEEEVWGLGPGFICLTASRFIPD